MPIDIPRSLVNRILHYAQQDPNREVCGLVGAREGIPVSCYPVANVAEQPDCRFLLDAAAQIEAMRRMRECGEDLFAVFHSHPTSPAEPSVIDLEQASYREALYLIVSLGTKGVLELRGFRIGDGSSFQEVPLRLQASGTACL
jgi:proteasome lid subunit RPN8/RPN11